jgi:hypothetical protein
MERPLRLPWLVHSTLLPTPHRQGNSPPLPDKRGQIDFGPLSQDSSTPVILILRALNSSHVLRSGTMSNSDQMHGMSER